METFTQLSFENLENAFASKGNKELKKSFWLFTLMNKQSITNVGTFFIKLALELKFPIKNIIKNTLFKHFCGGEDLIACDETMNILYKYKVMSILDYSVEASVSEEAFKENMLEIISSIKKASESKLIAFAVFKSTALVDKNLLEKVQAKKTLSTLELRNFDYFKSRFENICREAYNDGVKVLIDAEESWIQEVIDELALDMMRKYNALKPIVFNTFQMYRKDKYTQLETWIQTSKQEHYYLGVKLVRGAYLQKEIEYAADNQLSPVVFKNKELTDIAFNDALELVIQNIRKVAICVGSHNEESNYLLYNLLVKNEISYNHPHIYVSQLFGMSDHISFNMSQMGFNTSKYLPYGPVEKVMPYLFRRAEENTSIAGQTSRELNLIKSELKRRNLKLF